MSPRPATRRLRSVSISSREPSSSMTRIGICRSGRLKRARFWSASPMVAMRAVRPMAAAETPSSAARASRGTICSSGRSRLATERTPERPGTVRICRSSSRAAAVSVPAFSPTRVMETLAPEVPSAPKRMRAPGMRLQLRPHLRLDLLLASGGAPHAAPG